MILDIKCAFLDIVFQDDCVWRGKANFENPTLPKIKLEISIIIYQVSDNFMTGRFGGIFSTTKKVHVLYFLTQATAFLDQPFIYHAYCTVFEIWKLFSQSNCCTGAFVQTYCLHLRNEMWAFDPHVWLFNMSFVCNLWRNYFSSSFNNRDFYSPDTIYSWLLNTL